MSKLALAYWNAFGLYPVPEFLFHPKRKWAFDYAWPDLFIAAEIEGGIWTYGAHVRGKHFMSDLEKYNTAAKMGWRVFRFTPEQLNDGVAQSFMVDVLKGEVNEVQRT